MNSIGFIIIAAYFCNGQQMLSVQTYSYPHYSRHHADENIYDNETLTSVDDDKNMCHLSVRCPGKSIPSVYDQDNRNRRFTIDTLLAMHGPPGPPGIPGPSGSPGLRGAVGPQGPIGRSKEPVPVIAFVAYLQKMLFLESNRSEIIVFEKTTLNEGKAYNPTTGIFTAAYQGVYKFTMTIMAQMDSVATVRVIHNENNVLGMIRCDCRRRFSHVRGSFYAELQPNDRIMAEAVGEPNDPGQSAPRNNIYGYTYTHFSGALLFLLNS